MFDNPFVGPVAIPSGKPLFGRDEEAAELIEQLLAHRIVLLHSPSGAGKTSLVGAKIRKDIEKRLRMLPILRVAKHGGESDERNPLAANALRSIVADERYGSLAASAKTLTAFVDEAAKLDGDELPLLVVLDQFEEVLTTDVKDLSRVEFFRDVGHALTRPDRWAILCVREEFIPAMEPFFRYIPTQLRSRFRLDLLTVEQAKEAAQKTAQLGGKRFEGGSLKRLMNDLSSTRVSSRDLVPGNYVEPVYLQVVCRSLWQNTVAWKKTITVDKTDGGRVQDVTTAIASYYETTIAGITKGDYEFERTLRTWFNTTLTTDAGYRRPAFEPPDVPEAPAVLAALADAYLIRVEKRAGGAFWIELAHDRLVDPLRASNADWIAQHLTPFERQTQLWVERGRPQHLLLPEYEAASLLFEAKSPVEREYIKASLKAAEAARKERRLRRSLLIMASVTVASLVAAVVMFIRMREIDRKKNADQQIVRAAVLGGATGSWVVTHTTTDNPTVTLDWRDSAKSLLGDWGWPAEIDSQRLTLEVVKRSQDADTLLQALVSRLPARDQPIRVEYWRNDDRPQRERIKRELDELRGKRFDVVISEIGYVKPTNVVWYSPEVEQTPDEVRAVALTLLRAGVEVKAIRRSNKRDVIQIGFSSRTFPDTLTAEEIFAAPLEELRRIPPRPAAESPAATASAPPD